MKAHRKDQTSLTGQLLETIAVAPLPSDRDAAMLHLLEITHGVVDIPLDVRVQGFASGKRIYIITARRITAGNVLKYRNGFLIRGRYETRFRRSSNFALTLPAAGSICPEVCCAGSVLPSTRRASGSDSRPKDGSPPAWQRSPPSSLRIQMREC